MKADKELLQLAAKAVGLRGMHEMAGKLCYTMQHGSSVMWNPLDSDGDALWLAVDLELMVDCLPTLVEVYSSKFGRISEENYGNDKHAATRRAIVRAAAAIGEGME